MNKIAHNLFKIMYEVCSIIRNRLNIIQFDFFKYNNNQMFAKRGLFTSGRVNKNDYFDKLGAL